MKTHTIRRRSRYFDYAAAVAANFSHDYMLLTGTVNAPSDLVHMMNVLVASECKAELTLFVSPFASEIEAVFQAFQATT